MREVSYKDFAKEFYGRLKTQKPIHGQIELTYRCGFRCPYCYLNPCQSNNDYSGELSFGDWVEVLDDLYNEGCMSLTFTGGDPLLREDFADIYLHAKTKGFNIITGTKGNFGICIDNIRKAVRIGLPIILKTNGLKINKDEVIQIKKYAKGLLG